MITLLLVDDSDMIRETLRGILEEYENIEILGEAADGVTAFHLALSLRPDVVLMDIGLSRLNGIDATRRIKDLLPDTIIIGLSIHSVGQIERAMLVAGASAFFSKDVSPDELVAKIRSTVEQRSQSHTNA
ncbi:MAG: response regulator transcription factor [Nitrospiraceae bacterium]